MGVKDIFVFLELGCRREEVTQKSCKSKTEIVVKDPGDWFVNPHARLKPARHFYGNKLVIVPHALSA